METSNKHHSLWVKTQGGSHSSFFSPKGMGFSHLAATAISPFLTTNQYKNDLTFIKSELAKKQTNPNAFQNMQAYLRFVQKKRYLNAAKLKQRDRKICSIK